jgi:hypothetical protein
MAATSTTSTGQTRSGLRWGGISGIVFVVLFVVGFLMTTDTPDGDASNREWLKYFRDSGNRRMLVIGALIFAVALLGFLLFLGALRERLHNASPGGEWVATAAFASGIAFVAMVAVFALGQGSVAAGVQFGDNPVPRDADIMRTLTSVGFGAMLVFGAASAGLLVITTSVAGGRAGLLSRWLAVTGYVVGVIVIVGGLIFFPFVLFVLWVLAVSIVMLRGSSAAAAV